MEDALLNICLGLAALGLLFWGMNSCLFISSKILPARIHEWLAKKHLGVLESKRIWLFQVVGSLLMLKAMGSNRYSFYIHLRWTCLFIFGYLALQSAQNVGSSRWARIFGLLAIVYNPIIPFHLTREIWGIINAVTIAILLASIPFLKEKDGVATAGNVVRETKFELISRLSMRAAGQIARAASKFSSKIEIIHKGNHANAKTVMEILMLSQISDPKANPKDLPAGTPIWIRIEGPDASAAMETMSNLMKDASVWPA